MAITESKMIPLRTIAPDFKLPTGDGQIYTRNQIMGQNGLLVVFMSNHCPFVIHIAAALAKFSVDIKRYGVGMVGINANDIDAYPADAPDKMVLECEQRGYQFPYLFDQTQEVAKAYGAVCTPEFFLFDRKKMLIYRGQFDDSRPGNGIPICANDITRAVDALSKELPPIRPQKPSIGCNIKWK